MTQIGAMKTTAFVVALAGVFLLSTTASAKKPKFPKRCKCSVTVPDGWKLADPDPKKPTKIKFKFKEGGSFLIASRDKKLPLDKVVDATVKTAKEKGWTVLKRGEVKVAGNPARRLVMKVPTHLKNVITKQVVYFMNTAKGYRTLHFTARDKNFEPRKWAAIAQSYSDLR